MSLNLDEIEDMGELFKIMTSLDLQPTGCKTLDQMKGKINEHLKHLGGSSTRKVGEVSALSSFFSLVGNKGRH